MRMVVNCVEAENMRSDLALYVKTQATESKLKEGKERKKTCLTGSITKFVTQLKAVASLASFLKRVYVCVCV